MPQGGLRLGSGWAQVGLSSRVGALREAPQSAQPQRVFVAVSDFQRRNALDQALRLPGGLLPTVREGAAKRGFAAQG